MPLAIVGNRFVQLLDELRALRARPDEAHLSAQHVQDLRQLVDARGTDERADAGDAAVVLLRPLRLPVALGVLAHAAELEQLEWLPVLPDAHLTIQDGRAPAVAQLDGRRREQHDRRRCLLYTSDAADERSSVDLGGRRIIK